MAVQHGSFLLFSYLFAFILKMLSHVYLHGFQCMYVLNATITALVLCFCVLKYGFQPCCKVANYADT